MDKMAFPQIKTNLPATWLKGDIQPKRLVSINVLFQLLDKSCL